MTRPGIDPPDLPHTKRTLYHLSYRGGIKSLACARICICTFENGPVLHQPTCSVTQEFTDVTQEQHNSVVGSNYVCDLV